MHVTIIQSTGKILKFSILTGFLNYEKIPNFSRLYFPFSQGPRSCIGQVFSKFESKVILARILRKFRFELLPGQTSAMEKG